MKRSHLINKQAVDLNLYSTDPNRKCRNKQADRDKRHHILNKIRHWETPFFVLLCFYFVPLLFSSQVICTIYVLLMVYNL